jgi:hypothetical protein
MSGRQPGVGMEQANHAQLAADSRRNLHWHNPGHRTVLLSDERGAGVIGRSPKHGCGNADGNNASLDIRRSDPPGLSDDGVSLCAESDGSVGGSGNKPLTRFVGQKVAPTLVLNRCNSQTNRLPVARLVPARPVLQTDVPLRARSPVSPHSASGREPARLARLRYRRCRRQ